MFRLVRGYTLRDRLGRIVYVGITNNPRRREGQHWRDGKRFALMVGAIVASHPRRRPPMGDGEASRVSSENGRLPRYNRTATGGRWG